MGDQFHAFTLSWPVFLTHMPYAELYLVRLLISHPACFPSRLCLLRRQGTVPSVIFSLFKYLSCWVAYLLSALLFLNKQFWGYMLSASFWWTIHSWLNQIFLLQKVELFPSPMLINISRVVLEYGFISGLLVWYCLSQVNDWKFHLLLGNFLIQFLSLDI